ncbi:uncharacterized protein EV420DRAFT_1565471 [Desarmillaria tabescens]|uniref:Uncharacterized protein n=1 Tax=Armillaria tabescens TaxID=1929756 RepID=A0AA39MWQ3_ARMTA|nr:uncharacterized protein EV420DRAFT_1565471 [Desarmillaria tabescens]KAK0449013.1 hypothetical protein EV420DRAFT_1565471 [Desarmillaria tabescens]
MKPSFTSTINNFTHFGTTDFNMCMAARNPVYIPRDLVDSIIDELRDDASALRACSLVGWEWRFHSLYRLFQKCDVVLRSEADFLGFIKCEYIHLCVRSLVLTYTDTSSGRCPPMMPNVFATLNKLECLTLRGRYTIKSMSSDTLVSLGRLSDSKVGALHTLILEELGKRVSPRRLPSFPALLATFTRLRKLKISSSTQFISFGPEGVKSLLDVEELELSQICPGSWCHVAQFLDRRLKRLSVDICALQSDRCLEDLLHWAQSQLDTIRVHHGTFATALYTNPKLWGKYTLARDVFFRVKDRRWSSIFGTANELRALMGWYLDCFEAAQAETFCASFACENTRSSLFDPICDAMWTRCDKMSSESKALKQFTMELHGFDMEGRFCKRAIRDRLPRLSEEGKLTVRVYSSHVV